MTFDDIPVTDIERPEVWSWAERLGFKVPGSDVVSIHLDPSEVVVITADRNEDGNKFVVVDPQTHERGISTTEHRFRYADVQREYDEANARRAAPKKPHGKTPLSEIGDPEWPKHFGKAPS